MSDVVAIAPEELLQALKFSLKMPDVVQAALHRKIILQTAEQEGIEITPLEVQQTADRIRLQQDLITPEDTWSWLNRHHLTLEEFEEFAYLSALSTKLAQHLFGDRIADPDLQRSYTQVILYEVILEDADLALELFFAIQAGETTIAQVARQYAKDLDHRYSGGYQGLIRLRTLEHAIATAIVSAHPPQLLRPIPIGTESHLLFVEAILPLTIDEALRSRMLSDLMIDWLDAQIVKLTPSIVG